MFASLFVLSIMTKIKNPYNELPGYNCFGCSAKNPIGLHLEFDLIDDAVVTYWRPTNDYQGWDNVLHGGIIATLLDEAASWAVQAFLDTCGVTSQLQINYLRPVLIDKGAVRVEARLKSKPDDRHAVIATRLYDADSLLCAAADVTYYIYPQDEARENFNYCGRLGLGLD